MSRQIPSTRQTAAVISSPVNIDHVALHSAIDEETQRNGHQASLWFQTTAEDPGYDAARRTMVFAPDILIVSGGDGTISTVAKAAHERAAHERGQLLALIPTGTGNPLARNLHIPLNDSRFERRSPAATDRLISGRSDPTASTEQLLQVYRSR